MSQYDNAVSVQMYKHISTYTAYTPVTLLTLIESNSVSALSVPLLPVVVKLSSIRL